MHRTLMALIALSTTACSSVEELTGNTPIIDTRGVNIAQYEQDLAACQSYADQVAIARQAGTRVIAGAVVGSVFGAVLGNSETVQRGAGAGAIAGGTRGVGAGLHERHTVVKRCLMGRGYRVLN